MDSFAVNKSLEGEGKVQVEQVPDLFSYFATFPVLSSDLQILDHFNRIHATTATTTFQPSLLVAPVDAMTDTRITTSLYSSALPQR